MIKLHDIYFVGALIALSNVSDEYAKVAASVLCAYYLLQLFIFGRG